MKTIGDLLTRDLTRKIEEIIQVDQADLQSVHDEITEYVATDSIRDQYHDLLKAIAEAPSDPSESVGVWVSGFFGSGKSSFAKNLGYALENPTVLGSKFAELFKKQLADPRTSALLDLINAKTPTDVILFEVAKEADTRKVTQRIAELMYAVLLRELGYAEDFDIAELEIELEAEGKLESFIATCKKELNKDWETVRAGAQKLSRASLILHKLEALAANTGPSGDEDDDPDGESDERNEIFAETKAYCFQATLSYCLGVAFGRWDVRMAANPLLVPKISGPFDSIPLCPPGSLVGPDGLPAKCNTIVSEQWLAARPDTVSLPIGVKDPVIDDSQYPMKIEWDGILVDDPDHSADLVKRVTQSLDIVCGRAGRGR